MLGSNPQRLFDSRKQTVQSFVVRYSLGSLSPLRVSGDFYARFWSAWTSQCNWIKCRTRHKIKYRTRKIVANTGLSDWEGDGYPPIPPLENLSFIPLHRRSKGVFLFLVFLPDLVLPVPERLRLTSFPFGLNGKRWNLQAFRDRDGLALYFLLGHPTWRLSICFCDHREKIHWLEEASIPLVYLNSID